MHFFLHQKNKTFIIQVAHNLCFAVLEKLTCAKVSCKNMAHREFKHNLIH